MDATTHLKRNRKESRQAGQGGAGHGQGSREAPSGLNRDEHPIALVSKKCMVEYLT
jgi:hypothetical protein